MTQSVPYKRISRNRLQGNHGGGVRLERPEVWIFSLLPTFFQLPSLLYSFSVPGYRASSYYLNILCTIVLQKIQIGQKY